VRWETVKQIIAMKESDHTADEFLMQLDRKEIDQFQIMTDL